MRSPRTSSTGWPSEQATRRKALGGRGGAWGAAVGPGMCCTWLVVEEFRGSPSEQATRRCGRRGSGGAWGAVLGPGGGGAVVGPGVHCTWLDVEEFRRLPSHQARDVRGLVGSALALISVALPWFCVGTDPRGPASHSGCRMTTRRTQWGAAHSKWSTSRGCPPTPCRYGPRRPSCTSHPPSQPLSLRTCAAWSLL